MKNEIVRRIAANAIVAALYFALVAASIPLSFNMLQIRIAEFLVLLCFFRKDFIIGVTVGTLLANVFSTMLPWDLIFGTLATLIAATGVAFCRHLLVAAFIPVIANGFIVAGELYVLVPEIASEYSYFAVVGFVAAGEAIAVIALGYSLMMILHRIPKFNEVIGANQNLDFKW